MPGGVPVATFGIGKAGATNAALFACRMISLEDDALAKKLADYREAMRKKVLESEVEI
jgi:5-(carboxyamino)imidazole ribonucleotide mutase